MSAAPLASASVIAVVEIVQKADLSSRSATVGSSPVIFQILEGLTPCLQSTSKLSKLVFHLGIKGFGSSLSDGLHRTPLWSGMVVRLPPCEQEHCQVRVDSWAPSSGLTSATALPLAGKVWSWRRLLRPSR